MKLASRILQIACLALMAVLGLVLCVLNVRTLVSGDFLAYSVPVFGFFQHLIRAMGYLLGPAAFVVYLFSIKAPRLQPISMLLSFFLFGFGFCLAVICAVGRGSVPLYYIIPSVLLPTLNLGGCFLEAEARKGE